MKTRKIITVLMLSALTTGIFAQAETKKPELSAEQKVQMKEVREKYAPQMKEIGQEIKLIQTEQQVLLTSKEVDKKAVYANIDAMAELKLQMHKNSLAMRSELKEICPNDGERQYQGRQGNNGPRKMNQGDKAGLGRGNMQGQKPGQGRGQGHISGRAQGNNKQAYPKNGKQGPTQGMRQGAKDCNGQGTGVKGQKQGQREGRNSGLNLSEEQRTAMADIKKAHFWKIQETQNEIKLLKAKTSPEDQLKTADEMSALMTQLAKEKMAVKLEMREVLTEEQLMKMIAKQGMKKQGPKQGHKNGPQRNGRRG